MLAMALEVERCHPKGGESRVLCSDEGRGAKVYLAGHTHNAGDRDGRANYYLVQVMATEPQKLVARLVVRGSQKWVTWMPPCNTMKLVEKRVSPATLDDGEVGGAGVDPHP